MKNIVRSIMDSIIFLGNGGGRVVLSTQMISTAGFVMQLGEKQIFVDPGPGALLRAKLCGLRASKTDIIFVSHHHLDHANDVNAVIDSMTLGGINQKGILIGTSTLINGSETESAYLTKFHKGALKECFALKPGDKIKINELEFRATQTQHDCENNGFVVDTKNGRIGYTSDTAPFEGLAKQFEGCELLILNVLKPGAQKWKTHLCSEDVVAILKEVKPKLAVIRGFGAKIVKAHPTYEAREIQKRSGVQTVAAYDGMRIDLDFGKKG